MSARYVSVPLGGFDTFAYADGYADGRRDLAAGMVTYLVPEFHNAAYIAGYEKAIAETD